MNKITLLLSLIFMSMSIFGQNANKFTILGEFEELQRSYNQDSISLYQGEKFITSFNDSSVFAFHTGDEIAGKGYCVLYKDKIIHIILNKTIKKGSMKLGIYQKEGEKGNYELVNNYIDVIDNNALSFFGNPVSLEFLDKSILIVVDSNYEYRFIIIPDIEKDILEVLQSTVQIKKQ